MAGRAEGEWSRRDGTVSEPGTWCSCNSRSAACDGRTKSTGGAHGTRVSRFVSVVILIGLCATRISGPYPAAASAACRR